MASFIPHAFASLSTATNPNWLSNDFLLRTLATYARVASQPLMAADAPIPTNPSTTTNACEPLNDSVAEDDGVLFNNRPILHACMTLYSSASTHSRSAFNSSEFRDLRAPFDPRIGADIDRVINYGRIVHSSATVLMSVKVWHFCGWGVFAASNRTAQDCFRSAVCQSGVAAELCHRSPRRTGCTPRLPPKPVVPHTRGMTAKWKFLGLSAVLWTLLFLGLPHWLGAQTNTNPPAATNAPARSTPATNLIAQLADERREILTFGLDSFEPLRTTFLGNPLWQYLASLIYIVLAFHVAKFLDWLARVWLRKFISQTRTTLDEQLLELLNGPVKVIAFVLFLHIGLSIFHWPPAVELWLHKAFIVVLAVSLTYMVLKVTDVLVDVWRERGTEKEKGFNDQLFIVFRKGIKAFLVVVATLVTMQNLGVNVTAALASLSIGGLALGLAAQDTLANLFGAVAIFADKPFRVGDRIRLEAVDGTVQSIGLRSTRVRNLDGHLVTIPNKTMGNATITNITARPNIKTELNLGITYDTPTEKVRRATAILEEIYRGHPMTTDVWVSFNKFNDSALNLFVVHWWNGVETKAYLAGMQQINLEIKRRFEAEGIEFAFPTQTTHVRTQ